MPFESLKVVTADTSSPRTRAIPSGSNSMQGQRHRDPECGGAGARTADREAANRFDLPVENLRTENGAVIAPDGGA